ncbi:hypothetical protein [Polaromonas sp. YR568]|uniref:hypothetical protein n=1 Tax=Polaromonas sp. YR568 TaxID=1855301 RepID=UPI0031377A6C
MRTNSAKKMLGRPKTETQKDKKNLSEKSIDFGLILTSFDDGLHKLDAIMSTGGGVPFRIEFTFLLDFPNIWKPFAIGLRLAIESQRKNTKKTYVGDLRNGFFKFLIETDQKNIDLEDLSEDLFQSFLAWLNRSDATSEGVFSHKTRLNYYCRLRSVFSSLRKSKQFKDVALKILEYFPSSSYENASKKATPRERLHKEALAKMKQAAAAEILLLEQRFEEGQRLIAAGKLLPELANEPKVTDMASLLARIVALYPGPLPKTSLLKKEDKVIGATLRHLGGVSAFRGYLYPSARDLVPLVLLLTTGLALNPETVLTLSNENISRMDVFGKSYVVIKGAKNRAAADPVLTVPLDFEITPGISFRKILDLTEKLVARIRPETPITAHRNRLFLFVAQSSAITKLRSYGDNYEGAEKLACSDIAFSHNLKLFIRDHSLKYFSLANLRPTVLDDIIANTGDLKAAQALGKQKSPWTLLNHYTSDGTKQRLSEQLGEAVFLLRERWLKTGGLIDPRVDRTGFSKNRSSATPGFYCLDPFDSQRPGQKAGRLCTAYGECPDCPLAAASNGLTDVASYLSLRKRVAEALTTTTKTVWRTRWAPVFTSLEALISSFSKVLIDEAMDFEVKLPKLPEIG